MTTSGRGITSGRDTDSRMRVLSHDPLNAETSLTDHEGMLTPIPLFYHRNHFSFPTIDFDVVIVDGLVERTLRLPHTDLLSLPSRTLVATLECAGNGRAGFEPAADGEPWQYGAVSTAEWTGVPLASILEMANVLGDAREIVIQGADRGHVPAVSEEISYVRSLPVQKATNGDVLLAYAMNGNLLPKPHGGPLRLIVPGWYGMASVKWIERIEAVSEPFRGFYQADRYVLPTKDGETAPLTTMRVRSVIASPTEGAHVTQGRNFIRGMAWSGEALVTRVQVSVDGGDTWDEAHLATQSERYAWRRWELPFEGMDPGPMTLRSRAFDAAGNSQPELTEWNRLGYANNAIQIRRITVVP